MLFKVGVVCCCYCGLMLSLPALAATRNRSGIVVELLVASRLLAMGHRVAVPLVDDDGVDLVVDYRLRVQVKSSGLWNVSGNGHWFHSFKSPLGWDRADVYVFHGRSADGDGSGELWWVVPAGALVGVPPGLSLSREARGGRSAEFSKFLDAWHLFDE